MKSKTPIVLAAFGTTSRALDTYSHIDTIVKNRFPEHPVRWAYTSRMVRAHMKKVHQANMKPPLAVLDDLAGQGHAWAVVQSMHMICGHEFYRLIDDIRGSRVRTSMGLPLLTAEGDYAALAAFLMKNGNGASRNGHATVLVGHGTDHPAWTAYPALQRVLQRQGGNVHVAMVEGESTMQETVADVVDSGARHVHLVPLMLVAGVHLKEDIAGEEDSWKCAFQEAGLGVTIEESGLGKQPAVVEIFVRHIREALDVIP